MIAQAQSSPALRPTTSSKRVPRAPTLAEEPTQSTFSVEQPTEAPPPTEELVPTEEPPPTEELPTEEPPTDLPPPTRIPATRAPTLTPTPAGPTPTTAPTRCPKTYCVVYRGCQPDAGNTMIEGIVYKNGVPENGVVVRVAKEPGAYPLVDDFKSGNDPINPGQPDPNNPGRYILQIVAGAPREGHWWVFIVDVANGTKVLSDAKEIHTNDDPFNPANCQHAYVDFVR